MKKINLLIVLACIMAFASCSVEKRVHRKGYHVEWRGQKQTIQKADAVEESYAVVESAAIEEAPVVESVEPVLEPAAPVAVETPKAVEVEATKQEAATYAKQNITKKDLRKAAREMKSEMRSGYSNVGSIKVDDFGSNSEPSKGVLVLICFFIPPLAVYLYEGDWTKRCTVNLILTLLCGLPGFIHGLVLILGDK